MTDLRADLNHAIAVLAGTGDAGLLRIADSFAVWLAAGEAVTMEGALGVASTWRSQMHRRLRDALYLEIAKTRFPDLFGGPLARQVCCLVRRYEAGPWRGDLASGRPSATNALLFDLLSTGEHLVGETALRLDIFSPLEYPAPDLASELDRRKGSAGGRFEIQARAK